MPATNADVLLSPEDELISKMCLIPGIDATLRRARQNRSLEISGAMRWFSSESFIKAGVSAK